MAELLGNAAMANVTVKQSQPHELAEQMAERQEEELREKREWSLKALASIKERRDALDREEAAVNRALYLCNGGLSSVEPAAKVPAVEEGYA